MHSRNEISKEQPHCEIQWTHILLEALLLERASEREHYWTGDFLDCHLVGLVCYVVRFSACGGILTRKALLNSLIFCRAGLGHIGKGRIVGTLPLDDYLAR